MKNRRMIIFLTFTAVLSLPFTCFAELYYRLLFERGLFSIERITDQSYALPIFQEIVKRHPNDRYYAARSQFIIGYCYKRMESDLAFQAFQEVITNFPDQKDVVRAAEAELASLSKPKEPDAKDSVGIIKRRMWKGKSVYGMGAVSSYGRYFSYVDLETGDLMLYAVSTRKTRRLTHHGSPDALVEFAESPTFSPDGRQIAYGWKNKEGRSEMRVVGVDGARLRTLFIDKGIVSIRPADWSADSEKILVNLTRSDLTTQIVFVSTSDGSVRTIKDMGHQWPDHMRLSPDGRYLAYSLLQDEFSPDRDIFLYSLDEKKMIPLVVQPGDDMLLSWSPNGKNILYTSNRTGITEAWILSVQKGKPQPSARQIISDVGQIDPVGLTKNGTFYFEVKMGRSAVSNAGRSMTELWTMENFLPVDRKILTVPDDYPTIQDAVSAADPGDTVSVRKGVYTENIIISKPLTLQGEDREKTIIDGGGSGNAVHITASHVTVEGITVRNGERGIEIKSSLPIHHITLRDLMVTSNTETGIYSRNSSGYHLIENSIISHNGNFGLDVHQFSKSFIRNCDVFANGQGIQAGWTWYIAIEGNKVHHNRDNGITIDSCYYSTTERNLVYANESSGIIFMYISSRNTIKENIVFSNGDGIGDALWWHGFGEHRIYHNDVLDNRVQIFGHKDSVNFQYWDNGYPSGGNYWSDYSGQDSNQDGIGDEPHMLIGEARDNFPLKKPWNRVQAEVGIDSDWLGLDSKEDYANVYIELPAGLPVNDIDVSTLLLNDSVLPEKKQSFVGDYDEDGIPDMMVKFSNRDLSQVLQSKEDVVLTVSGKLKNGLPFEGRRPLKISGK
jgi:nitrous oxidase accessory protein NosD/Tol biopolymer transport system component